MNASLEKWGFVYTPEIVLPSGELIIGPPVRNKIPSQGIDHLAGLILGTSALIGNWYIGLVEQNYVPSDSSVALICQPSSARHIPPRSVCCGSRHRRVV